MKALYLSTKGDTTIDLPFSLEIQDHSCAVIEMSGSVKSGIDEPLYLCCDICEESIVGNVKMPVLRYINRNPRSGLVNRYINHLICLRVMRPSINSIRLYIANELGEIITVEGNHLNCTLLIKHV